MPQLNVAVVGAGLAGLSAAVYLAQHRHARVTVFEAAPYAGGQAASWRDRDGDPVETGIHLAFPWYCNFRRLYEDIGHPLTLVETDRNYYICDGRTGKEETLRAGRSALKTLYGSVAEFETAFFDAPLAEALVQPLVQFVTRHGGELHCGERIVELIVEGPRATGLRTERGERRAPFDYVALAVAGYLVPLLVPEADRGRAPFADLARLTSARVITLQLWYDERVFPDRNVRISNREGVIFDAVADKAHHWTRWSGGSLMQVLIDAADDVAPLTDDEIYRRVLADLARFFPGCRDRRPRKWHLIRHRDIYCATRPGYWSLVPRGHESPITNLYLAGDYTDGPYHYGLESAVISGKATARAILQREGKAPLPAPVLPIRYLPFVRPPPRPT